MTEEYRRLVALSSLALESAPADDVGDLARRHICLTTEMTWPEAAGDKRGPFKFSKADLQQMADNLVRDRRIDLHHATFYGKTDPEATQARGWVKAGSGKVVPLPGKDGEFGLEVLIDWGEKAAGWIKDKAFRFLSMEPGPQRELHGDKGKILGWGLLGGTLTNDPIMELPGLAFSAAAGTDPHESNTPSDSHAGGAAVAPDQYPREPGSNAVAAKEESMSDEIKALAAKLGIAEDAVLDHVTALAAKNAELETEIATVNDQLKTAEAERDANKERVDALSAEVAGFAKAREDEAIADALKGGLKNDEAIVAKARERYALSAKTGESYFDDFVKANSTLRTAPTGSALADKSQPAAKPEPEMDADKAGEKLSALARQRATVDGVFIEASLPEAFAAVLADPANKALVAAYQPEGEV